MHVTGVDMGDSGSMDSGRPETSDTDESSEVLILLLSWLQILMINQ